MKKQYIVSKYVIADSVKEAVQKSKKIPIHEVYVHNSWFEKQNYEWNAPQKSSVGFYGKKK